MKTNKPSFIRMAALVALFAVGVSAWAQSPYSKFGYGLLRDNATAAQRQMGGVGYAMANGRQINVMNPASYALRDTLTFLFDMGLDFTTIKSSEQGVKETNFGGGLDYITMQFPIVKRVGMSIGMLPWSSVGYAFGSKIENGSSQRQGSGGVNLVYAGWGYTPFKGFSVGANLAYMFGTTYNDVYVSSSAGTSLFEQVMEVRDFYMDFGLQYGREVAPRHHVRLGLTFAPGKKLHGNLCVMKYENASESSSENNDGTPVFDEKLNGRFSIPATWGAGINYEWNKRVMAEIDYTYQGWANAKYNSTEQFASTKFQNRWRVGAGLQWQPDPRGSYLRRVQYRIGGFYNRDYLTVNNNSVRDFGVSLGFGLPAVAGKTIINLGLEYKNRQTSPVKLLSENYINLTLGINFNERWFMQSKLH